MSSFTSYDGTRLAYETKGQGARLVCVPGGPGRAVAYLEDLGGLDQHRTLVLLDPRASGHSEVPADPGTLRFDRMALDLEALREHLALERMDLLAHSAGCLVAQAWASRFPDRVGRLVLVTPSGRLQDADGSDLAEIRRGFDGEPWYPEAVAAQEELAHAPASQRPGLERLARPFGYGRWDERTQAHASSADHQMSKRAMLGFSAGLEPEERDALLSGLGQVNAPVHVIGGSRDGLTGLHPVDLVARSFPSATTAVVDGAGHFPWVDEPEAFVHAVLAGLG